MSIQRIIWRREDAIALAINDLLRQRFNELAEEVGLYANIVGVFYHELMVYASNYVLIQHSKEQYDQPVTFPFLNTSYVRDPFPLHFLPRKEGDKKTFKQNLVENLSKFTPAKVTVAFAAGARGAGVGLFKKTLGNIKIVFETNHFCYLVRKEYQLTFLQQVLREIVRIVNTPNPEIFIENFNRYVESWVTDDKPGILADYLVTGTNSNISNRIISANYKIAEKQVIELLHGEQCSLTHDDPIMGYGELSYCDYGISFGSHQLDIGQYNKPLQKKPVIIQRSSTKIQKYYRTNRIGFNPLTKREKILFVPTGFSGNMRYGPFREVDDSLYKRWHEALLSLDLDITYKPHIKSKVPVNINHHKVVTDRLEECLLNYDFYFLDYISTASALTVATDKPIIYFNLGLMNLVDEALSDFKKRVFWVDIDLKGDLEKQAKEAITRYNDYGQDFINHYTEKYSLNSNPMANDIDIIKQIVDINSYDGQ